MEDEFYHHTVSWSHNNKIAIVLANSVFLLQDEKIDKIFEAFDCEEISSLSWNPDGTQLAIGNILGEALIWDLEKNRDILSFDCHKSRVGTLDWREQLLSGSRDKKAAVSDP